MHSALNDKSSPHLSSVHFPLYFVTFLSQCHHLSLMEALGKEPSAKAQDTHSNLNFNSVTGFTTSPVMWDGLTI